MRKLWPTDCDINQLRNLEKKKLKVNIFSRVILLISNPDKLLSATNQSAANSFVGEAPISSNDVRLT